MLTYQCFGAVQARGLRKLLDDYGLTQQELAILASSHSGEDIHVETVKSILHKLGLTEEVLNCGSARPMSGKAFKELVKNNLKPSALHNHSSLSVVEYTGGRLYKTRP